MALEQEDLDKIQEMVKTTVSAIVGTSEKAGGNDDDDPDDVQKQAAKAAAADAAMKAREAEIADSVKFNSIINGFVKENIDAFGGATGEKLLELLQENTKNENVVDRANMFRKSFIDQFIAKQANIDILPSGARDVIEKYRGLTDADKRAQSAKIWTVIESGLEIERQVKKAKQLAIARATGSDSVNEIPKHILVPKSKNA